MAIWKTENSMLTQVGVEILNKFKSGDGKGITITRIVAGTGRVSSSQLFRQTTVSGTQKEMTIYGKNVVEGGSEIAFSINNTDFTESFELNQIGVFVTHPDYAGEQLYHISQCEEEGADLIPPHSETPVKLEYSLFLEHSNDSSITITIDPLKSVNVEVFNAFKEEVDTSFEEIKSDFTSFKSGVKEGKLFTADVYGNLVSSGKHSVRGYPISVNDAMGFRALSLSIEGKSTQTTAPTPSNPVYYVNSKIEDIRNYNGSTAKYISFPSVIELRSLGDYKDTIEWDGAKWWKVQRIQELTIDGTINKVYSSNGSSSATYCRYALTLGSYKLIQDHVSTAPVESTHGNAVHPNDTADFYAFHYTSSNAICCHILNTITGVTSTQTATEKENAINAWFKAQYDAGTPVKVRYVLKTPIVTEITLSEVLEMHPTLTELSCSAEGNNPTMVLGYVINTTDPTTMYILKSLARKAEISTANSFATATLYEEE